jgi:hypothetical protein
MRDKGHTSYFKLTLKLEIIFDLIDCKDSWGCNWLESTGPTQHLGEHLQTLKAQQQNINFQSFIGTRDDEQL